MNALDGLIESNHRDEFLKVCSFLSDNDVLRISQVCKRWRKFCLDSNPFRHHEKDNLLKNGAILTSKDLDDEYEVLESKYPTIDNIDFYLYTKRRINNAYNKQRIFNHQITQALMGEFSPKTFNPGNFMYQDISLYDNIVAVGQPNGFITLIDIDTKTMISEFNAFSVSGSDLNWEDIVVGKNYIICSRTSTFHNMKIFNYNGQPLHSQLPSGRPMFISEKEFLILHGREQLRIDLYHLDDLSFKNQSAGESMSEEPRQIYQFPRNVSNYTANKRIIVVEHESENNWTNSARTVLIKGISIDTGSEIFCISIYKPPRSQSHFDDTGCIDYWFTVFDHDTKMYLAIYSINLMVFEIDTISQPKLIDQFRIIDGCRITLAAKNNVLVISCNDLEDSRRSNNLIYVIPFDVLVNNKMSFGIAADTKHNVSDKLERKIEQMVVRPTPIKTIRPILIIENMITSGVAISKTRIVLLHCNGTISDLNYKNISDKQKCELLENKVEDIPNVVQHIKNKDDYYTLREEYDDFPTFSILNRMKRFYGPYALWLPNLNREDDSSTEPRLHRFREKIKYSNHAVEVRKKSKYFFDFLRNVKTPAPVSTSAGGAGDAQLVKIEDNSQKEDITEIKEPAPSKTDNVILAEVNELKNVFDTVNWFQMYCPGYARDEYTTYLGTEMYAESDYEDSDDILIDQEMHFELENNGIDDIDFLEGDYDAYEDDYVDDYDDDYDDVYDDFDYDLGYQD